MKPEQTSVSLFEANPKLQEKWERHKGSFHAGLVSAYHDESDRHALAVPHIPDYDALQDAYKHLRSTLFIAQKLGLRHADSQATFDTTSTERNRSIETLNLNYGLMHLHFKGINEVLDESKRCIEDITDAIETGAMGLHAYKRMDELDGDLASAGLLLTQLRDDARAIQKNELTPVAAKEELATYMDTLAPHLRTQLLALHAEVMHMAKPLREKATSEALEGLENVTALPVEHREPKPPVAAIEAATATVTPLDTARERKGGRAPQ